MADVSVPGFRKYWTRMLVSLKSQCHAITNKYPEAASVIQQVHKYSVTLRFLPDAHRIKWGGNSEWSSIVNSVENRVNFCKSLDGKPLFSAVYGMYAVTLNELKDFFNMSSWAGQSGAMSKTSVDSKAQDDDFRK
jgi:hypothetical protein